MKKILLTVFVLLTMVGMSFAEDVRYPVYQVRMSVTSSVTDISSGTTPHIGARPSGTSMFVASDGKKYISIADYKPGLGVFVLSPYVIDARSGALSSATYGISYSVTSTPTPSDIHFTYSGTTVICSNIAYSGSTGRNWTFEPEFGLHYQFYLISGASGFDLFRINVGIQ